MSIKLMSMAWDLELPTTPKIVLLALCDWADDKGGSCFPSMETIAKKSSISPRTAQRTVKDLETLGFVSVVGNATGGAPGTTKHFRINVRALFEASQGTGDKLSGVTFTTRGVTSTTETGDTGVTQSTIEPPISTSKKERARAADEPEWLPLEAWDDFEAMRRAKGNRTPYTAGARKLALRELSKLRNDGHDLEAVLNQSVLNGWAGLFAPKPQPAAITAPKRTAAAAPGWKERQLQTAALMTGAAMTTTPTTTHMETIDVEAIRIA